MSDAGGSESNRPEESISNWTSIEQSISRAAEAAIRTVQEVRHLDPERESRDRSWIGRRIVSVFTGVIAFTLIVFLIQGWRSNDWSPVAAEMLDLIQSAVIPIVTLILGYYFGRSGRI